MKELDLEIKKIEQDFFRYRNGMLADQLRKFYKPGKLIYGLNVPQFNELAKNYTPDLNLGIKLWENNKSREARLFSFYLIPPTSLSLETAKEMILNVESFEEADLLTFKLLRHFPHSRKLLEEVTEIPSSSPIIDYCINMLKKNLKITQA